MSRGSNPNEIYGPNPNEIYMCTEEESQAHMKSVQLQAQWTGILEKSSNDLSWLGKLPEHLVSRACVLTAHICKDLEEDEGCHDCLSVPTAISGLAHVKSIHAPLASFTL